MTRAMPDGRVSVSRVCAGGDGDGGEAEQCGGDVGVEQDGERVGPGRHRLLGEMVEQPTEDGHGHECQLRGRHGASR